MIFLGSDHAGYALKERVKSLLTNKGIAFEDLGTDSEVATDYPDYAFAVAEKVSQHELSGESDNLGILVCGSGVGMDIAANKVKGVRAALALTKYMGAQSREHDNANVLVLAGRVIDETTAIEITEAFLGASFTGEERHRRRLQKIADYENKYLNPSA